MKFIGHLDTMRYFQKAIRRAGIDIMYSEGFNPHQKMSFAAPLGVGLTSTGEYMDIEVNTTKSSKEMVDRLNEQMVEGMKVISYRKIPDDGKKAMSIVAAADYMISFREGKEPGGINIAAKFEEYLSSDSIIVTKKTKKSEKEVDIKAGIFEGSVIDDKIFLKLASSSADYLKPELVISGFYNFIGGKMPEFALEIERTEVYAEQGEKEFISLEDLGDEIP